MKASEIPVVRSVVRAFGRFQCKTVRRTAAGAAAGLLALFAPATAHGFSLFGVQVASPPPGPHFTDILASPNDFYSWDLNTITYAFDPSFDALFPNPRIREQVRLGFQQWDNAGTTGNGPTFSFDRWTGSQPFGDIRSIFVHELGHVLGFHHPDQAAAVSRNFRASGGTFVVQAGMMNTEVMGSSIGAGAYNHILSHDELEGFQLFAYPGRNLNFVEVAPGASPNILISTFNPSDPNIWAQGGPATGFFRGATPDQGVRIVTGSLQFNIAPGNPLGFRTLGINWDYQNVSGQPTRSFRVRTRGTDNLSPIFHYDNNGWPQPFLNFTTAPVGVNNKDDVVHTWSNPTGGDIPASEILHVGLELDVWDWTVVSATTVSPIGTVTAAPVTWSHSWNNTIVIGTPAFAPLQGGIRTPGPTRVLARGFRIGVTDVKTRVSAVAIADVTGMKLQLDQLNRNTLLRLQEGQRLLPIDGFNPQDFEPDSDFIFVLDGKEEDLPDDLRQKGNFLLLNRPDLADRELFIYTASENEDAAIGTYTLINTPPIGQAALPALEIFKLPGGGIRVCWPDPSNGYLLQNSPSLSPPQWAEAPYPPELINGKICVTILDPRDMEFFRLRNGAGVSSGVVGYLNLNLPQGFSMIANQFITGENNVATVLGDVPDGTTIYKYANNAFSVNQYFLGWDNPGQTLLPGEGAFIFTPQPLAITLCGNVREGDYDMPLPEDFSIVSLLAPRQSSTEDLGIPAEDGDQIFQWDGFRGSYDVNSYFLGWDDGRRVIKPGEAFWYKSFSPKQWRQSFQNSN